MLDVPAAPQPIIYIVEPFGGSIRLHNPSLPSIYYDDAGLTRGDGVFESLLIADGHAANVERHLERFQESARLLHLPAVNADHWRDVTYRAVEQWNAAGGEHPIEARCTWTYTRGRAATGIPSAWITIQAVDPALQQQRDKGLKILTASRGYTMHEGKDAAPWLVGEAKTLNYATNLAAQRWAREHDADDVLFIDPATGRLLEATTASLLVVKREGRLRTPTPGDGVLPGTSVQALFDAAEGAGWKCKARDMTVRDLEEAESVWLVSSVRRAVRVRSVNGTKLPAPENAAELAEKFDEVLKRP